MKHEPTEWTILAPGPSLKEVTSLRPMGPIVGINSAIRMGVPLDFWVCQDRPEKLTQGLSLEHSPIVWCPARHRKKWEALGYRTWYHPDNAQDFRNKYVTVKAKVRYTSLSVVAAIARSVGMGARKLVMYGVDNAGVGYGFGKDVMNRKDANWHQRWKGELTKMDAAVAGWVEEGVEFEWKGLWRP